MAIYLAVDKDGTENIFQEEPWRHYTYWASSHEFGNQIKCPKGTILRLIGRELEWEDEALEVTEWPDRSKSRFGL
jgi:hypothetical protein